MGTEKDLEGGTETQKGTETQRGGQKNSRGRGIDTWRVERLTACARVPKRQGHRGWERRLGERERERDL